MKRRTEPVGFEGLLVRIQVGCRLDEGWSAWFEDLSLEPLECGGTRLVGTVTDQAALHGLLLLIRDLGVPLLGLQVVEPDGRRKRSIADGRQR